MRGNVENEERIKVYNFSVFAGGYSKISDCGANGAIFSV